MCRPAAGRPAAVGRAAVGRAAPLHSMHSGVQVWTQQRRGMRAGSPRCAFASAMPGWGLTQHDGGSLVNCAVNCEPSAPRFVVTWSATSCCSNVRGRCACCRRCSRPPMRHKSVFKVVRPASSCCQAPAMALLQEVRHWASLGGGKRIRQPLGGGRRRAGGVRGGGATRAAALHEGSRPRARRPMQLWLRRRPTAEQTGRRRWGQAGSGSLIECGGGYVAVDCLVSLELSSCQAPCCAWYPPGSLCTRPGAALQGVCMSIERTPGPCQGRPRSYQNPSLPLSPNAVACGQRPHTEAAGSQQSGRERSDLVPCLRHHRRCRRSRRFGRRKSRDLGACGNLQQLAAGGL